jgi:hypothetical protein
MDRRQFVMSSAAAATLASTAMGANERVRVAVVGVRGQGRSHLGAYGRIPDVEIAAICDIDESILDSRIAEVEHRRDLDRDPESQPHASGDLVDAGRQARLL